MKKISINVKRIFIKLNGPIFGCKGTRRFLKVALLSMYSSAYPFHFKHPTRSEMMKQLVTSKIIRKINANVACSQCLNKMMNIF